MSVRLRHWTEIGKDVQCLDPERSYSLRFCNDFDGLAIKIWSVSADDLSMYPFGRSPKVARNLLFFWCLWLGFGYGTATADPAELGFGGRLTYAKGAPVPGPVDLDLSFYHDPDGGVSVAHKKFEGVALNQGVFQLRIAFDESLWHQIFPSHAGPSYVEVYDLTNDRRYPRQQFSTVPYALKIPIDGDTLVYNSDGELTASSVPFATTAATAVTATNFSGALDGDVSGPQVGVQVKKILGLDLAGMSPGSPPSPGQVLKYVAGAWRPAVDDTVGAGGEANVGNNLGGAGEVFESKTGVTLNFRGIAAGNGIDVTQGPTTITVAATGSLPEARLQDADGTNHVIIKAPDTVTADRTFIWPDAYGVAGQVLRTDGAGGLSWVPQPIVAVSSVNSQTGAVTLDTDDVPEGMAKYFSTALARGALSSAGGPITYSAATGAIGIVPATSATAGSMSAADKAKLDAVEAGADQTDTASVALSGAVMDSDYTGDGILARNGASGNYTLVDNNSANWNTAYNERGQWSGSATNLVAATGRASLELGSLAIQDAYAVNITGGTLSGVTLTMPGFADDAVSGNKVHGGTISNFSSTGITDSASATAVTVSAAGKVGIGTATPAFKLSVIGDGSTGSAGIGIDSLGTGPTSQATLRLVTLGDGSKDLGVAETKGWELAGRGQAWLPSYHRNDLQFNFWNGAGWKAVARFDSLTEEMHLGGPLGLREQAASPTTNSSYGKIFPKSDKELYYATDAGKEYNLTRGGKARYCTANRFAEVTTTAGAFVEIPTLTCNMDTSTGDIVLVQASCSLRTDTPGQTARLRVEVASGTFTDILPTNPVRVGTVDLGAATTQYLFKSSGEQTVTVRGAFRASGGGDAAFAEQCSLVARVLGRD